MQSQIIVESEVDIFDLKSQSLQIEKNKVFAIVVFFFPF